MGYTDARTTRERTVSRESFFFFETNREKVHREFLRETRDLEEDARRDGTTTFARGGDDDDGCDDDDGRRFAFGSAVARRLNSDCRVSASTCARCRGRRASMVCFESATEKAPSAETDDENENSDSVTTLSVPGFGARDISVTLHKPEDFLVVEGASKTFGNFKKTFT